MKRKNRLSESVDSFGIVSEGVEISIPFTHNGKQAEAIFELEGGKVYPGGRVGPDEMDEPSVEFQTALYKDSKEEISKEEIKDYQKLEDEAVTDYMSNLTHHYPEY